MSGWEDYKRLKNEALKVYEQGALLFEVTDCEDRVASKDTQIPLRQVRAFTPEKFNALSLLVEQANAARPEALKPRQRVMPRLVHGLARIVNLSITDASNIRKMTSPGPVPIENCEKGISDRKKQGERLQAMFAVPPEGLVIIDDNGRKRWAVDSGFLCEVSEVHPLWIQEGVGKRYEARVITEEGSQRVPIALLAVQQEPGAEIIVQKSQVRRTRSDKLDLALLLPNVPNLFVLSNSPDIRLI